MLGTIEDLEKDIEQFRGNVAASGEMCKLLEEMLEQIKQQNVGFAEQSSKLIKDIESLPETIDTTNKESNDAIQKQVSESVNRAVQEFAQQQTQYVNAVSDTSNHIKSMEGHLTDQYQDFVKRLENVDLSILIDKYQALESELNKRTTILTVISIISVAIGIIGLFVK